MGANSLPKTVIRQRRGCDLNPNPSSPESSTLTTRLPSRPTKLFTFYLIFILISINLVEYYTFIFNFVTY